MVFRLYFWKVRFLFFDDLDPALGVGGTEACRQGFPILTLFKTKIVHFATYKPGQKVLGHLYFFSVTELDLLGKMAMNKRRPLIAILHSLLKASVRKRYSFRDAK